VIAELYPVTIARSALPGRRLNILLPTMKPMKIYGGITSAIGCARGLFTALKDFSDIRVIVTSDDVDADSMRECATRLGMLFALTEPNDDVTGAVLVNLNSRRNLPLALRAGDVFFCHRVVDGGLGLSLAGLSVRVIPWSTEGRVSDLGL